MRSRSQQAEVVATSDSALLVKLATCRLSEASLAELEEFLRCCSKTKKQVVNDSELLGEGTPLRVRAGDLQATSLRRTHQRSAAIVAADRVSKPEFLQPDIVSVW